MFASPVPSMVSTLSSRVLSFDEAVEMDYSPALLVPISSALSFHADPEYHKACKPGFITYFEEMYERDTQAPQEVVFQPRHYSDLEVGGIVVKEFLSHREELPLGWRVGFLHGWLSALALTNRVAAQEGAEVLCVLVQSERTRHTKQQTHTND
ncbi:hypothetical protein EPA93_33040 [Ktedonosporobacter rubrisoli]|uniref:Uncharacterized protein n=1 Tax=Ktedonosporobacter rubrisoli TaxID=2509675 RepID=A0A4P6JXP9_KTERU|nr:hypothetical protein [Ktedonosporobacter rubrisoli]QBD80539.1 hypothetical protein EPA93_33040 [Ktedonosporobacter rubrisoli]